MRYLLIIFIPLGVFAQIKISTFDSIRKVSKEEIKKISISDYLIISSSRDTTYVDTTLTLAKYYKFNNQRQDNFAYIPLNNSGQALNPLSLETWRNTTAPSAGFKTKESQRFLPDEVFYYHVPTPLSELFFKTTQSQGQSTDALITANIHPRLNYSIGYRAHRSLGKYQHQISGFGHFRFSTRYENPNQRYRLRLQMVNQKIEQQENGGLEASSILDFESGNKEFHDRERLSVLYENVTNYFNGKRYLIEQDYLILRSKDSIPQPRIRVGYRVETNIQDNRFSQSQAFVGYGALEEGITKPYDRFHYSLRQYDAYTEITSPSLGWLSAYARHYNYRFQTMHLSSIPTLGEEAFSVGGSWRKSFGNFKLRSEAEFALSVNRNGNFLSAEIVFPVFKKVELAAGIRLQEQHPGFVFEQFASSYQQYHWSTSPKLEQRSTIFGYIAHPVLGKFSLHVTNIQNHAYFLQAQADNLLVSPMQSSEPINILQMDWDGGVSWGCVSLGFNTSRTAS